MAEKTFYVDVRINVTTSVKVTAEDLQEAMEKARGLGFYDFFKKTGNEGFNDGEIWPTGGWLESAMDYTGPED